MSNPELTPREHALDLISNRHTEQEVSELVREFDNHSDTDWVPLGREPNNYSIVENQQADAMAAFVELVINSIDSIILKAFFEKYGDNYDGDEYQSLEEAADDLIEPERDEIEIFATGEKNGPYSLTLYDNGRGQTQSDFEHTFLNVLTPGQLKQQFSFLQGKYGMGSTGVLPFCGEKGYKLICSASYETPGEWAWSIIRKNRDEARYEYLVINGTPPRFRGEIAGKETGTFVKCFEYQNDRKSTITKRFRHRLERYITKSPVSIRLNEKRYDGYGVPTTRGLLHSLENRRHFIQGHDRIEHAFDNPILGSKVIDIYLMKAKDQLREIGFEENATEAFVRGEKQTRQAILFTFNGQTHGDQGQTFLQRRCNLRRISNDTLVIIDFTDINDADVVDLFKPSRDRLQNKEPAKVLKAELEQIISDNEMLRQEEERRKTKDVEESTEELEEEILDDLLRRNPALKGYLKEGKKQPAIDKPGEVEVDYEGEFYPSVFNIIKKYRSRSDYEVWKGPEEEEGDVYDIRIPSNKSTQQHFELNAANDYLTRDQEQGEVTANLPSLIKSKRLTDGILITRLELPDAFTSGDSVTLELTVSPAKSSTGELSQSFRIQVLDPVERTSRTSVPSDDGGSSGFELPDAYWVSKENWNAHGFNEHSIVSVEPSPDDEMTLYINEDAAPLTNFRRRHNLRESGKQYVRETYKIGIILYSVGQFMELERAYGEDPRWEEIVPAEVVETTMKGVAESLLDQTITDEKLDEITYS